MQIETAKELDHVRCSARGRAPGLNFLEPITLKCMESLGSTVCFVWWIKFRFRKLAGWVDARLSTFCGKSCFDSSGLGFFGLEKNYVFLVWLI